MDTNGKLVLNIEMGLSNPTELTWAEVVEYVANAVINAHPYGSHYDRHPDADTEQLPITHNGGRFGKIDVAWVPANEYANV